MLTHKEIIDKIDQLEEANILLTALELRVYTILGKNWMTAGMVSRRANTRQEGTESLLNALAAMGALSKKGAHYANTSETCKHFCETSPHYKMGTIRLRRENRDEFAALVRTIRYGRDLSQFGSKDDPKFRDFFTYAMHERSESTADKIARIITRKKVGRILDLGGGPGSYSAAILRRDKSACAVVLDRRAAIRVASKIHQDTGIFKRMKFLVGDLFDTDYGNSYSTIFFSNILHIYNPAENKKLLRKIYKSLNRGGRLIINDLFLEDSRTKPYDAALFSLTMLLFTKTGKSYTFSETEALLKSAGFSSPKRFKVDESSSLIEAVKK